MSKEQKQETDVNKQLLDLVHRIGLASGFQEALALFLDQANELVICDGISVMLLSSEHLDVVASKGPTAPLVGLTLPISQMGASQAVLDSGRAVVGSPSRFDIVC